MAPHSDFRSNRTFSEAAQRLIQCRSPMTVSMPLVYQSVSGPGNLPPLRGISEPGNGVVDIGKISVESNVVLIGRQNIIVPPT